MAEVIEHAIKLPIDARRWRGRGEVFHSPGFHAPWGIPSPWVQTLLDLIPLAVDEPELEPLRKRWQRFGPRYRDADAVIAISRHAADEGIRLLGLDPKRIHVAHLGVDPMFSPAPCTTTRATVRIRPYLLVVAEYSRRKGFAEAFAVIGALADAGYPHTLKVAGQVHDFARAELRPAPGGAAGTRNASRLLGYVADLPALYRRASARADHQPLRGLRLAGRRGHGLWGPRGGFRQHRPHRGRAGGGLLVADGDVDAMVKAVRTLLDNPDAADEWRQKGLERAARSSPGRSRAARHAEVYRSVAERRG